MPGAVKLQKQTNSLSKKERRQERLILTTPTADAGPTKEKAPGEGGSLVALGSLANEIVQIEMKDRVGCLMVDLEMGEEGGCCEQGGKCRRGG
jgi:hypothetical protein